MDYLEGRIEKVGEGLGSENEEYHAEEQPSQEQYAEFESFLAKAESDPDLKFFANNLRRSVINYAASVEKLNRLQKLGASKDDIETADHSRRNYHDGVIDKLNILSRGFNERGWDNRWRKEIGMSREEVSEWALRIAKRLIVKKDTA